MVATTRFDAALKRTCRFLARSIAVAGCLAAAVPALFAASAEEDFRSGLSAFNRGDFAAAMRLWRPLAEGDDARSQTGIGFMYHRGLGVTTDDTEAAFWLRKAAEQGQAEGQLMLGSLYFFGMGVPQSYPTAFAWCELAQDNGQAEGQICRDAALQSITAEAQRRDAFRMAQEFRERFGRARGQ
jgi:TPR repeat protein